MLKTLTVLGGLVIAAATFAPAPASAASFGSQADVATTAPASVEKAQYYGYRRGYGRGYYGPRRGYYGRGYGPRRGYYGGRRGFYGPGYGYGYRRPGVYFGF